MTVEKNMISCAASCHYGSHFEIPASQRCVHVKNFLSNARKVLVPWDKKIPYTIRSSFPTLVHSLFIKLVVLCSMSSAALPGRISLPPYSLVWWEGLCFGTRNHLWNKS